MRLRAASLVVLATAVLAVSACTERSEPAAKKNAPIEAASASSSDSAAIANLPLKRGQTTPSDADASAPSGPVVRFVALGDTGKGNDGARRVARAIEHKCKRDGCDFAILLGDNIYENGISSPNDPLMAERFEKIYAGVQFNFYPVLGNHDYGHNGLGTDFTKGINEVLYTDLSTKWKMPDAYYALSFGPIDIFALDTNMANFDRAEEQDQKMSAAIKKSTAPWKLAYGHHPYKSNGPHGNAGHYNGFSAPASVSGSAVKGFLERVVCGKVDVYLCGHDHSLQWLTDTCNGTELGVSGAGAETTTLPGADKTRFQSTALGFMYIVADAEKLTIEIMDDAEKSMFRRVLEKH